jgi:transposase
MERIVKRCCGLDVHKKSVTACVRVAGGRAAPHQEIREFAATTQGLLELRDWLASFEVELVGMEATGVYWKPLYYVLEDEFELWLLNAEHLRHVPGRKTDVRDAEWICQLVEHGLVRPSFVPPKEIRELRNLTRYRKVQIEERTREIQRLEKVLQEAAIKLSSVASQVLGISGRVMLEALISGTTDPEVLAELARGRLRSKIPALKEALEGHFSAHHALMASRILAHIDYLDEAIAEVSADIERVLIPFSEQVELLDTIPGVNRRVAETIIAEIGVDMEQFPTHHHLASWAGMCPGSDGVQPRALLGQKAGHYTHSVATGFDLPVVGGDPLLDELALVPGGVVPDHQQRLLTHRFELLRAPRKELRGYGAHRTTVHEPQPSLARLGQVEPATREGLRVGVVLFRLLVEKAHGLPGLGPRMQAGLLEAAPPGFVLVAHHPLGVALGEAYPPPESPFFLAYSGSGLSIQRLARFQRTPSLARTLMRRMGSRGSRPRSFLGGSAVLGSVCVQADLSRCLIR